MSHDYAVVLVLPAIVLSTGYVFWFSGNKSAGSKRLAFLILLQSFDKFDKYNIASAQLMPVLIVPVSSKYCTCK